MAIAATPAIGTHLALAVVGLWNASRRRSAPVFAPILQTTSVPTAPACSSRQRGTANGRALRIQVAAPWVVRVAADPAEHVTPSALTVFTGNTVSIIAYSRQIPYFS